VRIEHIQHSKCREDFLKRREANDAAKVEAKKSGSEYPFPLPLHVLDACGLGLHLYDRRAAPRGKLHLSRIGGDASS
jgi:hypothetical protein